MIKDFFAMQAFVKKLKTYGITSVMSFLEICNDPATSEDLRQKLDVNVTPEQWSGAVAVVRELFKD